MPLILQQTQITYFFITYKYISFNGPLKTTVWFIVLWLSAQRVKMNGNRLACKTNRHIQKRVPLILQILLFSCYKTLQPQTKSTRNIALPLQHNMVFIPAKIGQKDLWSGLGSEFVMFFSFWASQIFSYKKTGYNFSLNAEHFSNLQFLNNRIDQNINFEKWFLYNFVI